MMHAMKFNVSRVVATFVAIVVAIVAFHVVEIAYTLHVIESCAR